MGKGGSSAPSPDPNIGKAAMLSAETGQDFLSFMRDQAQISNEWADTDRARQQQVFVPLQDEYIAEAQKGPDYTKVAGDVRRSAADVTTAFDSAQQQQQRRLASMGVNPASGRSQESVQRGETSQALASAGAMNQTRLASRQRAEAESDMRKTNAINLGSGLAVNPATSLSLSNGATSSGFQGAMQGLNQQGNLLNTQYQQQMQTYQAEQAQQASLWGGIGSIAGLGVSLLSSKDAKEEKRPVRGVLDAVREMPVEAWKYKKGAGDEGHHVGPYAEDFHAATGMGDGRSIPLQDIMGMTLGAVQELAEKVDDMEGKPRRNRTSARAGKGVAA